MKVFADMMRWPKKRIAKGREKALLAKSLKVSSELARQEMLDVAVETVRKQQLQWKLQLERSASRLAEIADKSRISSSGNAEAVDIGLNAWQLGGIGCMKYLFGMVQRACMVKDLDAHAAEVIAGWWDGIGTWHGRLFGETEITKPI